MAAHVEDPVLLRSVLRIATPFAALLALTSLALPAAQEEARPQESWPRFRGPLDTGEAPHATPPLRWSEDENVAWKLALPGPGHSTPVVWGERLYLTAAAPFGEAVAPTAGERVGAHDNFERVRSQRLVTWGIGRATGEVLWRRDLSELVPHEGGHKTGTFASASPVTDGEHVFAFFGSHGLFAMDMDGVVMWEADLGDQWTKHGHGEGASPTLHGDTIFVNWDHEGSSFVVALDKHTGEERWRKAREEVTSWATPIIALVPSADGDGEPTPQLVVPGTGAIRAYDVTSGAVLWECGGLSHNVVASPVFDGQVLYSGSSYEKQAFVALDLRGAAGELSTTDRVLWYRRRVTPYVPSPLLLDGWLYFLSHYQGPLQRVHARTGEQPTRGIRLDGIRDVYASPLGANGHVYIVDRSGETVVLKHADSPTVVARNVLDDSFSASPVAVGKDLYLRGERWLYCLREQVASEETR